MVIGKPNLSETSRNIEKSFSFAKSGFLNSSCKTEINFKTIQDDTSSQNSDKLSQEEFLEKVSSLSYGS